MLNRLLESSPHEIWKWLVYALVLLVPGSFIALAGVGLIRHLLAHNGGPVFAKRPWTSAARLLLRVP
jgi:hypothetical protein